ncbi:uncharacterized protein LOC111254418 isoform X1 [Varroa destructor]|uniref:Uncharacterized protein n=1 Tax=Varroa destructor TaxID=109461 RepID=A0A7M7KXF5_VARDE|nr:uncharacterized protein LOC111254418 isoform X1 [Varroa destructor]XP_022670981.1 uncharacterized protein LOC111254418 isoform X1 [Varroa destructor]XP_022670983.1 uncharacterized protein LOC111254418 isoform X1 [Varroa destructor]XP_022670984.1 uncharacterized protein LOC111254418 isoform X1 [Varroa destructor]XP_022670985.1 uncharacterized protein LOC111254418 isoform X1 [Varroa destructor]
MKRTVIVYALLAGAVSADVTSDQNVYHYLETRCGLVDAVVVDTVMTIQLRDNTHPIEARPECRSFIEFKAKKNYSLQATIRNLHLTESSPQKLCLTHFLMVVNALKNETHRMCHYHGPLKAGEVGQFFGNELNFFYTRKEELKPEHDMEITVTSIIQADSTTDCPDNMFKCIKSQICVPETSRCDGAFNCGDYSDERDCGMNASVTGNPNTEAPRVVVVQKSKMAAADVGTKSLNKTSIVIIGVGLGLMLICFVAVFALITVRRIRKRNDFQPVFVQDTRPPQQETSVATNQEIDQDSGINVALRTDVV